jgi:hypothetical protein
MLWDLHADTILYLPCRPHINDNTMSNTRTLGFSFKIENITLQPLDEQLRTTQSFVSRDVIDEINEKLKPQNFKVDEGTLRPKYINDQLYLDGFAIEIQEKKEVGFLSGR